MRARNIKNFREFCDNFISGFSRILKKTIFDSTIKTEVKQSDPIYNIYIYKGIFMKI